MSTAPIELFHRTTSRWGQATMLAGLVISLSGPMYLMFGLGHWPGWGPVLQAWVSIAAVFGVLWVAEPITYYPMLGAAGTYQAFMIGNIANKLLPSALTAQTAVGARQGTAKAEITAVTAIVGAAVVHLFSLAVFVGLLGSWIVSIIPPSVQAVFEYIVPAIFGPVFVQAVLAAGHWRTAVIGIGCGLAAVFVLVPLVPSASVYGMAVAALTAVVLAVLLRDRSGEPQSAEGTRNEVYA
jgi:hypothetical protein